MKPVPASPRWKLPILAAALLVLAFLAGRWMQPPPVATANDSPPSDAAPEPASDPQAELRAVFASAPPVSAAASPAAASMGSALASQLPDDTPVMEVIEALDARARAGDAGAACRIGAELKRCRSFEAGASGFEASYIDQLARQELSAEALEAQTQALNQVFERRRRLQQHCEAVTPEWRRQLFRYHLAAGLRGNAASAMEVVGGGLLAGGELMRDVEIYSLYRAHAWRLFQIAFEAGHPLAVLEWNSGAGSDMTLLSGLMPETWHQPEVAAALVPRVFPLALAPRVSDASPAPSAAQAEAERLYQRYFAHSPWRRHGTPDWRTESVVERAVRSTRLTPCEPEPATAP